MSHTDERRRLPRRRTLLSAAAVYGEDDAVVACTVRDKSLTGARLLLQAGGVVPDAFHLIELTTGELHAAKVVWRDSTFVGVTFSESCSLAAPKTPEHKRLAELRTRLTSRTGAR
jgi:hypothetical protein